MNLLQIRRVAGHIVTNEERRRPQTSLLSAWREGKGQDGFGLARNLVERRRFIYPPARRLLGAGSVKLSAMKLSSIFLSSIRWMRWRDWICAKRQESVIALKTLPESIIQLVSLIWDQVDNYSRLSITVIRGENCANRSHGPTIAPVVLRSN